MTKAKTTALSYFLGRTFFLGFGFSILFQLLNKDTWIAAMLGSIVGFLILLFFERFKEAHPICSIFQKGLFFLYNFFIFSQILFIFETFCSSFYLIRSPILYIILPIPFVIYKITKNSFSTIAKVSEVLFPISVFIYILVIFGLLKDMNLDYFQPILTASSKNILIGTIYFAIYSTAPFFLLWNVNTDKKLAKSYFLSMISVFFVSVFITGILGPNLSQIYRFPEYMTMKKIKLFNFIEKVENIVSITWLFSLFITLAITGWNMKELLPQKRKKLLYIGILILLCFVSFYAGIHYQEELWIYHLLPIILGGMMLLLVITSIFPKKKKSKS